MHFYMVYARLGSPWDHLYTFLHGVHSPGLPWGPFVCIFLWCTRAWAPLEPICMHFYMVYTRLDSPGGHLYVFLHGAQQAATQSPSQPAKQPTGSPLTREPLVGFYSREGGYLVARGMKGVVIQTQTMRALSYLAL